LACCMYVDLNPVRAAMAESPESSTFTSAYDRIKAAQGKTIESAAAPMRTINRDDAAKILKSSSPEELANRRKSARERRGPRIAKDAWLAPLTLNPRMVGPAINKEGLRASDKGFLNMSLDDYIALLFWTGRQGREDKKGKITNDYAPILAKLGIAEEMWCDLVWNLQTILWQESRAGITGSNARRIDSGSCANSSRGKTKYASVLFERS
jgi:hypothetical protein